MRLCIGRPVSPRSARRDLGLQKCITFSVLSMLGFGITSYVMALATGILESSVEKYYWIGAEWKMMAIIWLSASLPGIVCYLYHWVRNKRVEFFWSGNTGQANKITVKTKALTLLGGVLLGLSLTLMKKAFVFTSPAEKGPVTAILGTAIVVVSLYGHFVFGELLTKKHVFLIIVILVGVVISSLGSGSSGTDAHTGAPAVADYKPYEAFSSFLHRETVIFQPNQASPVGTDHILGFAFAVLAMLSMSGTTLLIRYSAIGNVSTWSGFASRQCVLSVMALVAGFTLARSDDNQDLPATVLPNEVIGLAVIAGLSQALAIFALNAALLYPSTSLVNVIASSHSVVVLFLNLAIDGLLPCLSQLVGMSILLTGVILSSLLPPSTSQDEIVAEGKNRALQVDNQSTRESLLDHSSLV
ncbi:hypothetical protein FOZ61_007233 [Perkinsus olseni]|uniref:Uncharacterized protein n=1 Tax=Perkinsus olseni TaxID=32597 RepID=A0A7J6LA23_PEROL|nr:hypothetical protein FOZ61_007233 [Perkinsus olseni]KAF4659392.1 hypothetical protein FOL46_006611 [Perkinsus olseni]